MFRRISPVLCLLAIAVLTQQCGDSQQDTSAAGNGTPAPGRTAYIHGNAMLGAVVGSQVSVYAMDANTGALDTNAALGTVTTSSTGEYNITVSANSIVNVPFGLRMHGGSYTEESGGHTVNLDDTTYTTLLPPLSSNANVVAALGPLPDMAYQIYQKHVAQAGAQNSNLATLVANASYQVSAAFGITDVVGTLPSGGNVANDAGGQYALILAAISHEAAQSDVSSVTIVAALTAVFATNGNLTALGNANVTVADANGLPVTLVPPSFATLQNTVTAIGNGNLVITNFTPPAQFQPPTFQSLPPLVAPDGYIPGLPGLTSPGAPTDANSSTPTATPTPTPTPSVTSLPNLCTTQTWSNYGHAFFQSHCLSCHGPGGEADGVIDLTTLANVSGHQSEIADAIEVSMPPSNPLSGSVRTDILAWLACPQLLP